MILTIAFHGNAILVLVIIDRCNNIVGIVVDILRQTEIRFYNMLRCHRCSRFHLFTQPDNLHPANKLLLLTTPLLLIECVPHRYCAVMPLSYLTEQNTQTKFAFMQRKILLVNKILSYYDEKNYSEFVM
jgi:hypothetical protein